MRETKRPKREAQHPPPTLYLHTGVLEAAVKQSVQRGKEGTQTAAVRERQRTVRGAVF